MAIAFRAITAAGGSGVGDVTFSPPTGTTTDDVIVVALSFRGGNASAITVTAPAGWLLIERLNEGSHMATESYWKLWDSGDISYTWTFSGGANKNTAAFIASYSGCHTTAPIDAFATTTTNTNSVTVSGPSVVTTFSNDMLLAISVSEASGQTFTGPSGYTFRGLADSHGSFNNSGCSIEMEELAFVGPGATTAWTSTQTAASSHSFGTTIALRDAASAGSGVRMLASTGVGK